MPNCPRDTRGLISGIPCLLCHCKDSCPDHQDLEILILVLMSRQG